MFFLLYEPLLDVLVVVSVVRINCFVGFEQRRWSCVRFGVTITIGIPTVLIISVLSVIAAVFGVVWSTICFAVNFVHMSVEPIDDEVRVLRM